MLRRMQSQECWLGQSWESYTPLLSSKWTTELSGLGLLNANKNISSISHQFLNSWHFTKKTVLVDPGEILNRINLLLDCSLIETKSNDLNSLWTEPVYNHCCLCIGCGTWDIQQTGLPCGGIKPSLTVVLTREALCCRILYRFKAIMTVCSGNLWIR